MWFFFVRLDAWMDHILRMNRNEIWTVSAKENIDGVSTFTNWVMMMWIEYVYEYDWTQTAIAKAKTRSEWEKSHYYLFIPCVKSSNLMAWFCLFSVHFNSFRFFVSFILQALMQSHLVDSNLSKCSSLLLAWRFCQCSHFYFSGIVKSKWKIKNSHHSVSIQLHSLLRKSYYIHMHIP